MPTEPLNIPPLPEEATSSFDGLTDADLLEVLDALAVKQLGDPEEHARVHDGIVAELLSRCRLRVPVGTDGIAGH